MDEVNDYDEEPDLQEQIFHNNVREQIIILLLFLLLYILSFTVLKTFKKIENEDYFTLDQDEITVYRISTWLCTFSLAVSIAGVLLLPISIISNEVLISYPNSYYIKWLNSSLIHGLWNYIFLFSNVSLFVLLPFTYLFAESVGFLGYRKGIVGRVYETLTVLSLLGLLVLGITYVISALIDKDNSSIQTLLNLWSYYLPFLYSCISFFGVLMLLVCTPLGFVKLFDVVGQFYIKPQFLKNFNEEYYHCVFEEECLRRRLKHAKPSENSYNNVSPLISDDSELLKDEHVPSSNKKTLRNGELFYALLSRLNELEKRRKLLDKRRKASAFKGNLLYPLAMLSLIGLTSVAVLLVAQNTVALLIGLRALNFNSTHFNLGTSSLSQLGSFGAALEVILIFYMIATSSVGLYTTPFMSRFRPIPRGTPFGLIVGNCALLLIFSSALPVLSKILGITNFDLLGHFGNIDWLDNLKIVVCYNILFATASTFCLINKLDRKSVV